VSRVGAIGSVAGSLPGFAVFQQLSLLDTPTMPALLGVVLAACAASLAVTALSAYRTTHARPLDVLRYQ
jgi:ABC-type lipoprotein release transport system permease subunit